MLYIYTYIYHRGRADNIAQQAPHFVLTVWCWSIKAKLTGQRAHLSKQISEISAHLVLHSRRLSAKVG